MVARAGLRDPCTRDVARLSESVKKHEPKASVFYAFRKSSNIPSARITQSCTEKPFGNCFIK